MKKDNMPETTLEDFTKEVINVICDSKDEDIEKVSPRVVAEIGWMSFSRLLIKKGLKIVPQ